MDAFSDISAFGETCSTSENNAKPFKDLPPNVIYEVTKTKRVTSQYGKTYIITVTPKYSVIDGKTKPYVSEFGSNDSDDEEDEHTDTFESGNYWVPSTFYKQIRNNNIATAAPYALWYKGKVERQIKGKFIDVHDYLLKQTKEQRNMNN
eukprot:GCRY01005110.1.p2 GENE.GCRY01005110.1~~GCRY01005110.1.p2  ORF type:complete len:149 (+),score=13.25 GCRY01005110.1:124-570(+)